MPPHLPPQIPDTDPPSGTGRVITWLHRIEDGILVGLLLIMMLVATAQILLRNLFDSGLAWGDPMVRVLVLWIGLLGAMAATRTGRHIRIDIASRYLPRSMRRAAGFIVHLGTGIICGLLTWTGLKLVIMEKAFGTPAFGGVPVWVCSMIIPVAFAVICLRYLLLALYDCRSTMEPPR